MTLFANTVLAGHQSIESKRLLPSTCAASAPSPQDISHSVGGTLQRPFQSSTGIAAFGPATGSGPSPEPSWRADLTADRGPPFPLGLDARNAGHHVGGLNAGDARGIWAVISIEHTVFSRERGPRRRSTYSNRAAARHDKHHKRTVLLNIGKCLTFRFLLHRGRFHDSPGTDVSAFLSTGCHRGTRGEVHQVDCGVAIPIVDDAAFNA